MALPKNIAPIFNLVIPSTKKTFKYRPFLVREEKSLLIAQQTDDPVVMLDTIKDVIASCAKSEIHVDKLATFDIEYIFLQLRANSVGEFVDLQFPCDIDHGEDASKALAPVRVDLRTANVNFPEDHTNKIHLFGDVGVVMKYPTIETVKKIDVDEKNGGQVDDAVIDCIDFIYNGDEIFYAQDHSREELVEFINDLSTQQFSKVQHFFRTMPSLRIDVEYNCPVCGRPHKKYMEGLQSFF